MPGKQNYSLAITWALDHDPLERVHQALAAAAGEEAAASSSGCMEADGTVERRKTLKIRRSASAQDAAEVGSQMHPYIPYVTQCQSLSIERLVLHLWPHS